MRIWVKIHEHNQGKVIAVCDEEVLGNTYEEGIKILDVVESFYRGEIVDISRVIKLIEEKDFSSVNIVGNKVIEALMDQGVVKNFEVIAGMKYVHIYKVRE